MNAETINRADVMQLATTKDGRPWICTVYFVVSEGKFYWLSLPERRHSLELAENSHAAVAIALKKDAPVTGIQAEGEVRIVHTINTQAERVLAQYVAKYGKGKQFIELLKRGENHHQLYCLTPSTVMLFDEYGSPDRPYKSIKLQ